MSKENEKNKENKSLLKFLLICVCSAIAGFLLSFVFGMLGNIEFDSTALVINMANAMPVIYAVGEMILLGVTLAIYLSCKKTYKNCNGDEECLDSLETKLDIPLVLSSVAYIYNMALFPLCFWLIDEADVHSLWVNAMAMLVLFVFVFGLVWVTAMQNAIIKFVKVMNPEKRGSVFDMDFHKKWLDSCDEGQQLMVYKAGYAAYRAVSITCIILWVVSLLLMFTFHTGIWPVIFVCIIFLVATIAYGVTAKKLETTHTQFLP